MRGLGGHFPELAQQKFSSNVVEKCLKLPGLSASTVCFAEVLREMWIAVSASAMLLTHAF